jgi:hypothetical protein
LIGDNSFTVSAPDRKSCPYAATVRIHLGCARPLLDLLTDGEQLRGARLHATLKAIAHELEAAALALATA